jgi:hypothetical protein
VSADFKISILLSCKTSINSNSSKKHKSGSSRITELEEIKSRKWRTLLIKKKQPERKKQRRISNTPLYPKGKTVATRVLVRGIPARIVYAPSKGPLQKMQHQDRAHSLGVERNEV